MNEDYKINSFVFLFSGGVFPIPLTISNEDPNFTRCLVENGVYVYTTNCSLFHLCTFGIHTIYSCLDGFFFNPISSQCQHFSIVGNKFFENYSMYFFRILGKRS